MRKIALKIEPVSEAGISGILEKHRIHINRYAEEFIAHPRFSSEQTGEMTVLIASLRELGFENGANLNDLFRHIPQIGMKACPPCTGLFLRSAWIDQPRSRNSILSGTHASPDQAVTVLSEILEQDDAFPKGLYLRNVDGDLWLRGYVCDQAYRFPPDAVFAFLTDET